MILSMRWLSEFVDLDPKMPIREFTEAMTMTGSKVEGFEIEGSEIKNVVVGKVTAMERHPDSDHMFICMVDVGEAEPLQIVTGAQNVTVGSWVPAAKHKSTLPGGVEIKKGKLRGVASNGMLCSLKELGLTVNDFPYAIEDGIFLLEEDGLFPGQDIHEAIGLNDTCVEFEITSNRPDCLSVMGLAREASATFGTPLKQPHPQVKGSGDSIENYLKVTVSNSDICQRYMARVVKNVKIGPSPRWMRERLRASGVRPINNLVDITNYVMLEYGQPMHAFDLRYVKDNHIQIRNAAEGETITTLDGAERKLSADMLVIADGEKPTAVAGVMGGEYSGIHDGTSAVVFESACFQGTSVRVTSKKLGMRTEASSRYEKGLDSNTCSLALERACELVEMLGAGEVVDGVIDCNNDNRQQIRLPLDSDKINRFLGIDISADQMKEVLKNLEFTIDGDDIIAPSFRGDIQYRADVAEEIARIYGYNNIPTTKLHGAAEAKITPYQAFEKRVNTVLLAQGLSEISTYSFISPKYYDKIRLPADSPLRRSVTITNPLGEDTSVMRTTTIPSVLEVLSRNFNNRNESAWMYEVANEYIPTTDGELPIEKQAVTIGMYGNKVDFYRLKGIVETLLDALNITGWEIRPEKNLSTYHPGRCGVLSIDGEDIGVIAQAHPKVAENYGIEAEVYLAVLEMTPMFAHRAADRQYRPLPKFPAITRDLALLCDEELPVIEIEKCIRKGCGNHLEKVELFDVYRGSQIKEGKKSVAYTVTLRSSDHTLTDQDADSAMNKSLKALNDIGVVLRT